MDLSLGQNQYTVWTTEERIQTISMESLIIRQDIKLSVDLPQIWLIAKKQKLDILNLPGDSIEILYNQLSKKQQVIKEKVIDIQYAIDEEENHNEKIKLEKERKQWIEKLNDGPFLGEGNTYIVHAQNAKKHYLLFVEKVQQQKHLSQVGGRRVRISPLALIGGEWYVESDESIITTEIKLPEQFYQSI